MRDDGGDRGAPGGRLYGAGQEDEDTRLLRRRPWERRVSKRRREREGERV